MSISDRVVETEAPSSLPHWTTTVIEQAAEHFDQLNQTAQTAQAMVEAAHLKYNDEINA